MIRRLAGLGLLVLGLWLFWGAVQAVLAFTSRGGPLMSALMEPPTSLIRLIGTGLMLIGGFMTLLKLRLGGSTGLLGALVFAALGGLMAAMGTDSALWLDEVVYGGVAIALAAVVLALKRA
ncbi:hypothetical protein RYZ27_13020 [Hyphomonas sp. FCG-A18]|uniref:hypothetical protein n=1 Tax=Hyphomonas sp. FCG-A18 TaxID=3080019 RepID=UPI002B31EA82|nr:hypothetical protein RYZ27_13020 [Hyphomonas sp. FCG-A18]